MFCKEIPCCETRRQSFPRKRSRDKSESETKEFTITLCTLVAGAFLLVTSRSVCAGQQRPSYWRTSLRVVLQKLCERDGLKRKSKKNMTISAALTRTAPLISLMNAPSVRAPHPSASTLDLCSRFTVTSHFFFFTPSSTLLQLKPSGAKHPSAITLLMFVHVRAAAFFCYLDRGPHGQFISRAAL